jgi:hypothetical protein
MVISISRPYFAPFPGYFLKAHMSDVFVILDQVQFPLGTTWITRNRFKNDQGTFWMTIPVWKKNLGLQSIDNVRICHEGRWSRKHMASFEKAYAGAPYFQEHYHFLAGVFASKYERILDFNLKIIQYLFRVLNIGTQIVRQSELAVQAKGDRLLIEICLQTGASDFLVPKEVCKFLDADQFNRAGIQLKPYISPTPVYPQLWGDFIANLSIFDLMFNCGPKALEIMVAGKSV